MSEPRFRLVSALPAGGVLVLLLAVALLWYVPINAGNTVGAASLVERARRHRHLGARPAHCQVLMHRQGLKAGSALEALALPFVLTLRGHECVQRP